MPEWGKIFADPEMQSRAPEPALMELLPVLKAAGCRRVLDAGCGVGRHLLPLLQEGFLVWGADLDAAVLKILQQRLASTPADAGRSLLSRADLKRLPFQAAAFDLGVSIKVINRELEPGTLVDIATPDGDLVHHFPTPEALLAQFPGYEVRRCETILSPITFMGNVEMPQLIFWGKKVSSKQWPASRNHLLPWAFNRKQNHSPDEMTETDESSVLVQRRGRLVSLVLNRPRVLNTLNLETIRRLHGALEEARVAPEVWLIVLSGAGERGFCAGGDLKELFQAAQSGALNQADEFFREEYALDLLIHQFTKPVLVLADGITMGGGLGLAAGADLVVATERSRMAMPETRIGFFPDVGATGWLFDRCPPGYPEYLALTGYELMGSECVRLGLATHLTASARLPELWANLTGISERLGPDKSEAVRQVRACLDALAEKDIASLPEFDAWVAEHFAGKRSIEEIVASLRQCSLETTWCREVFQRLAERSPAALALTLKLLRANEGRPLPEVFQREARAAHLMIQHPDYLEGIRARLIDKDDKPRWQPESIPGMGQLEVDL